MARIINRLAKRLRCDRNVWESFERFGAKYTEVNLSSGYPDYAPSEHIHQILAEVAAGGNKYHQYARYQGHTRLVEAIANLHSPLLERKVNPMEEVIVTHGAYSSLSLSMLGLLNAGDEVILFEPFFDVYQSMAEMADGVPVYVPLKPKTGSPASSSDWLFDPAELASKFSDRTKMIVLNNPVNPVGKVFSREELEVIAELCVKHDVICLSDEVYEWLVYPGHEHVRIANIPGMWERTITISSASKGLGVTGWRIGWSVGPKDLIDCIMVAHESADNVVCTPAQEAVARALEMEVPRLGHADCHFTTQLERLNAKRDHMVRLLRNAGFTPCVPDAGPFMLADWTSVATAEMVEDGLDNTPDFKFASWLVKNSKIASVPASVFCEDHKEIAKNHIRFCFFRTDSVLDQAGRHLDTLKNIQLS